MRPTTSTWIIIVAMTISVAFVAASRGQEDKKDAPPDALKKGDEVIALRDSELRVEEKAVGGVRKGERLSVEDVKDDWLQVRTGETHGWVRTRVVIGAGLFEWFQKQPDGGSFLSSVFGSPIKAVDKSQRVRVKLLGVTFEILALKTGVEPGVLIKRPGVNYSSNITGDFSLFGVRLGRMPAFDNGVWVDYGDVTIFLEPFDARHQTLTMNGKSYGTVAIGDHVVVNKSREVIVSGGVRFARRSPPWHEARSEEGRFVACFPKKPEESKEHVKRDDVDITAVRFICSGQRRGEPHFAVTYKRYPVWGTVGLVPVEQIQKDFARQGVQITEMSGARQIMMGQHTGRELRYRKSSNGVESSSVLRELIVGDTAYQIEVVCEGKQVSEADSRRFFRSFWAGTPEEWNAQKDNPPIVRPAEIRIVNPVTNSVTVSYTLDAHKHQLAPGEAQDVDHQSIIEFHQGGSRGIARYTLTEGAFTFTKRDDQTWDLTQTEE